MRTPRLPVVDWTDAPRPIEMDSSVSPKDEIWFLRGCHHISNAVYLRIQQVTGVLSQGLRGRDMKLTTHFHLASRFKNECSHVSTYGVSS